MKTATTLVTALAAILSISAQGVLADCYTTGDTWPDTEEARSFVEDACYSDGGMFTGNFDPLQMESMCPRSGGLGLVFEVQNQNDHKGFDLGDDDCYDRLTSEIFGCSHGGESVVAGWYFRADPGSC